MKKRFSFVPPGSGTNYEWSADHTFVKVSAEDTGGMYTLMEDNLKASFALGLHLHRFHAETFYILEGVVDFHIDGEWMSAELGTMTESDYEDKAKMDALNEKYEIVSLGGVPERT